MWCLNISLLKYKSFKKKIRKLNIVEEFKLEDKYVDKWDNIKDRIKKFCINYSKERRWKENWEEELLRNFLVKELELLDIDLFRCSKDYIKLN